MTLDPCLIFSDLRLSEAGSGADPSDGGSSVRHQVRQLLLRRREAGHAQQGRLQLQHQRRQLGKNLQRTNAAPVPHQ